MSAESTKRPLGQWLVLGTGVILLGLGEYLGLFWAPPEMAMGDVMRIIYIHVPSGWLALVAFLSTAIFSGLYLRTKTPRYDHIADASAKTGTVFNAMSLATGMIWAKPTWGVWWSWDPRLSFTLIMFLLYVAYSALRRFVDDTESRARWAAVYGIFASVSLPLVYYSANWFRSLHQPHSTPQTVDASMKLPLRINAFAFLFLMIWFIWRRYELLRADAAHESTPPPA